MTSRDPSIGRGAVVSACNILESIETNAELESLLLEYGLSDYVPSRGSISKTVLSLKEFAANNPGFRVQTDFGEKTVAALLIDEAIRRVNWSPGNENAWDKLERYLNLDGFALLKELTDNMNGEEVTITGFTVAMPVFVELPEADSEVEMLLDHYHFNFARQHLSSAKENITQADWEAANGQCRTFLDALTDAIADKLYPDEAESKESGLQKRQLLAEQNFLSREKHEFGDGHKQTFLPGLVKLLHPDGAHPGISTSHDAMFRLQSVVVTARWLLKRLENQ